MLIELPVPTVVAEGSHIQGNLNFTSQAHILGQVEGEVTQQSNESLIVSKSGFIVGSIDSSGPVIVAGRVEGNITSLRQIKLLPHCLVQGIIHAPAIQIQPGASINGEVIMQSLKEKPQLSRLAA